MFASPPGTTLSSTSTWARGWAWGVVVVVVVVICSSSSSRSSSSSSSSSYYYCYVRMFMLLMRGWAWGGCPTTRARSARGSDERAACFIGCIIIIICSSSSSSYYYYDVRMFMLLIRRWAWGGCPTTRARSAAEATRDLAKYCGFGRLGVFAWPPRESAGPESSNNII